jgi:hypothetical protein
VELLQAEDFPMPQPPIRFYPDGSLWTDVYQRLVRKSGKAVNVPPPLVLNGTCLFRPLAPFGGDQFGAPN